MSMKRLRVTLVCLFVESFKSLPPPSLPTNFTFKPFSPQSNGPWMRQGSRDRDQHRWQPGPGGARACLPCQVVSASFACPSFQATRFDAAHSCHSCHSSAISQPPPLIMSRTSALYFVKGMCTVLGEYKLHRSCNQLSSVAEAQQLFAQKSRTPVQHCLSSYWVHRICLSYNVIG